MSVHGHTTGGLETFSSIKGGLNPQIFGEDGYDIKAYPDYLAASNHAAMTMSHLT
jgi:hypothetical protein